MRKVEVEVFTFAELSDDAKECAREWYRQGIEFDTIDIIECTILDAAKLLGITIDRRRTGYAIDWDTNPIGAAFVGSWRAADVKPGAIEKEWPRESVLHVIARDLEAVAAEFPDAYANCDTGRGYFQRVEAYAEAGEDSDDCGDDVAQLVVDSLTSFAHWMATTIAAEYEYQYSDECVNESIKANGYEFTADGEVY
jgi:hypothetical protein